MSEQKQDNRPDISEQQDFKIRKGVPVPPELINGGPPKGGHRPIFPFRNMDPGDYLEVQIFDREYRERVLTAIRNTRKSRPGWVFVWKYGHSELPEHKGTNKMFVKVWRVK